VTSSCSFGCCCARQDEANKPIIRGARHERADNGDKADLTQHVQLEEVVLFPKFDVRPES